MHDIKVLSENQRLVQGRHGALVYNPNDTYIGKALELYGEYCEHEVAVFSQFVKPGMCVWDVGANIGALTLPLAKLVGKTGQVCAFEPQPVVFHNLCTNVSINSLNQVRCLPFALAAETGRLAIPEQNYSTTGNFGAVSFLAKQPNSQTAKQPNSQTAKQPNSQTAKQPNSQTAKQPNSQTAKQPNSQTAKQPNSQTAKQPNSPWQKCAH